MHNTRRNNAIQKAEVKKLVINVKTRPIRFCKQASGDVSRTIPFFSLLGSHVIVETFIGSVEGKLKHIDYEPSHSPGILYPKWLILENENGFIIIRHWQTVKVKA